MNINLMFIICKEYLTMKIEKLEKQKLSLAELENITAGTWEDDFGSTSLSHPSKLSEFCGGYLDNEISQYTPKGVIANFFAGLARAEIIDGHTANILILGTRVIGFGAIAAATTAVLCVKRIPQRLWRKFSNWLDK